MLRENYPNPSFIRPRWKPLNGEWEFSDTIDETLNVLDFPCSTIVNIPDIRKTETLSSAVFYRLSLELNEADTVGTVILCLNSISGDCEFWINGILASKRKGCSGNLSVDISEQVKMGENSFAIIVFTDSLYAPGRSPSPSINGNIWLEFTAKSHFNQAFLRPSYADNSIYLTGSIINPDETMTVSAELTFQDTVIDCYNYDAKSNLNIRIPVPNPLKFWNVMDGNLYEIKVTLTNSLGGICDVFHSYTAFRQLQLDDGYLKINKEPVFLRHIKDTLAITKHITNPAKIKQLISSVLCLGFNGIDTPGFQPSPQFIYTADKLGLTISSSLIPDGLYPYSEDASRLIQASAISAIMRNIGSPSFILWNLYNNFDGSKQFCDYISSACFKLNPEMLISSFSCENTIYGNYALRTIYYNSLDQIKKDVLGLASSAPSYFSFSTGSFAGAYSKPGLLGLLSEAEFNEIYCFLTGTFLASKCLGFSYTSLNDSPISLEGLYLENFENKISRNSADIVRQANQRRSISELSKFINK